MSEPESQPATRHPAWSEMRSFVEAETPSVHVIDGEPKLLLRLPGASRGIELLVPFEGDPPSLAPLAEIHIDVEQADGGSWVRMSTTTPSLFPLFYEFALVVADRAQRDGVDTREALDQAVSSWRRLLQGAAMLSVERQTGLYGELLLLGRLEPIIGLASLDAWTGPTGQAHDFRLGDMEIEVKTTRGERRVHSINGASQLEPSPRCRLYIASVQVAAAGAAGTSLAQLIGGLRERYVKHNARDRFSELIEGACAVPPMMEQHYSERLKLRTKLALVPVDDSLPRITSEDVAKIARPEMSRVSDLRFRLNLEGLGDLDGSAPFLSVLPEVSES